MERVRLLSRARVARRRDEVEAAILERLGWKGAATNTRTTASASGVPQQNPNEPRTAASPLDAITGQLEQLGYRWERKGEDLWFTHPEQPSFVLSLFRGGFRFFRSVPASRRAGKDPRGFKEFVNALNADATLARFFAGGDSQLIVEFWIPRHYDKSALSALMAAWNADNGRISNHPKAPEFLS
jgi:hypothetical protein